MTKAARAYVQIGTRMSNPSSGKDYRAFPAAIGFFFNHFTAIALVRRCQWSPFSSGGTAQVRPKYTHGALAHTRRGTKGDQFLAFAGWTSAVIALPRSSIIFRSTRSLHYRVGASVGETARAIGLTPFQHVHEDAWDSTAPPTGDLRDCRPGPPPWIHPAT